jgi:AcrR family transcriptional regulator
MNTRTRIIQAAAALMQQKGIARTTTKEIARAANCSEGNLYNHFRSKEEIFLCVLHEQLPTFVPMIQALHDRVGRQTVRSNLEEVAQAALAFYDQSIPMGASFFSERDLLARHRALLEEHGAGPHKANEAVAAYLHAEQQLGRIPPDADPAAMADMLLGACFIRAYWRQFLGKNPSSATDEQFIHGVLQVLRM